MTIEKGHTMKMNQRVTRFLCLLGLWLGIGLQAHAQTDTVTYVYTDPQGTPLVKADASGNVIARYDYTPYGNSVTSLGAAPNGPGYTGHVNDPETGLVYMQARYYQPIGRFLSPDPVGPVADDIYSFNRYAYTDNNPVNRMDPDGRCAEDACIVEGGVSVVAAVVYVGSAALVAAGACTVACEKVHNAIGNAAKSIYNHIVQQSSPKTLQPGPYAGDSIPARGPGRDFTPGERERINEIGSGTGCHTCGSTDPGTKSGNFVPDHQPPTGTIDGDAPQRLYPQCLSCSRQQGGEVRGQRQGSGGSDSGDQGGEGSSNQQFIQRQSTVEDDRIMHPGVSPGGLP